MQTAFSLPPCRWGARHRVCLEAPRATGNDPQPRRSAREGPSLQTVHSMPLPGKQGRDIPLLWQKYMLSNG